MKKSIGRRPSPAILVALLLATALGGAAAPSPLPEAKRVNSVKSLTNILSQIEKANSDSARFVTLRLQTYLEDVYISQGDAVVLKPQEMASAIRELLSKDQTTTQMQQTILRRYKDGEFHEG